MAKRSQKVQLPPSPVLVYGIFVAALFFVGLLILEIIHLVFLQTFERSIFSVMSYVVTFVLGAFFGAKKG